MGVLPLPITARRREAQFNPGKKVLKRSVNVILPPRGQYIALRGAKEHGINRKIRMMAIAKLRRVERVWEGRKTLREIRIMQALILDKIAAENCDFAIDSLKKVDSLTSGLKRTKNHIQQTKKTLETEAWEDTFSSFIKEFRNALPQSPDIIRTLQYIRRFTKVPLGVHFERIRRGRSINNIEQDLLKRNVDPEENLKKEIQRILRRTMLTKPLEYKKRARLRALDVIVASSIYADLMMQTDEMKKITNKEEKERFWDYAYSEGMEYAYPLLAKHKDILKAIINYNGESPKGKTPLPILK